jgi:thiol-disulfide isomerase/thioredoxin
MLDTFVKEQNDNKQEKKVKKDKSQKAKRDIKEPKEPKDIKEPKEKKDIKDIKEKKDIKEPKEKKDIKEPKEKKDNKDNKEKKDTKKMNQVIHIESAEQYEELKQKGLVIIDFNTTWCGPCKRFAPVFEQMAAKYPGVIFLSVDSEKIEHEDTETISSVPTFKVLLDGEVKREFSGVNAERLEEYIQRYQSL